jgi:hypothetical protein
MIYKDKPSSVKFTWPISIIIPLFLAYLFWTRINEHPLILVGGVVFSYVALLRIVYIWQSIFNSPRIVTIDEGMLYVEMLYGRKKTLKLTEIRTVVDIPWLRMFALERTILLKLENGVNLIFAREFNGIKDMLSLIRQLNPECKFVGKYFDVLDHVN